MLLQVVMTVILFHHCASIPTEHNYTFCVYQEKNSCEMCSGNYTDISQIEYLGKFMTINICSENFKLNTLITIHGSHSVVIKGLPSLIECSEFNSGLSIDGVNDLVLKDITLLSCGAFHTVTVKSIMSGILIYNCTDVTVEGLNLTKSQGNGLAMLENSGSILIRNSSFEMNGNQEKYSTNSGLYIEISQSGQQSCKKEETNYSIQNCIFSRNNGSHGFGGGLGLIFNSSSSNSTVVISNCSFSENLAFRGGAMFVEFQGEPDNNFLCIENSENAAKIHGGGIYMGFHSHNRKNPVNNSIELVHCLFYQNKVESEVPGSLNTILFRNCNWTRNMAHFGAAVNLTPQISIILTDHIVYHILMQLIIISVVHAICQPHKMRWHNVLDTLLFVDLTVVNGITLVNYYYTVHLNNAQYYINIASSLQLILLYIPIIYITVYISWKIIMKLKQWKTVSSEPNDYHEMTDSLHLDSAEDRQKEGYASYY